jgi:FkbM family methyltransferase
MQCHWQPFAKDDIGMKVILNMGKHLKSAIKRLLNGKYSGLNQLDRKLEKYVNYDNGYFVELGANDGIKQSNSLYFEKYRGWRGLLIEATPQNFLKCRRNRAQRSAVYCAACVSFDYDQEFVRMIYSDLMTAPINSKSDINDPRAHAQLGSQYLSNGEINFEFGAIARTLNSLLLEASAPNQIDLLSLDVEGFEQEVLQGVNHETFRFKYILVECRDVDRMSAYLNGNGYRLVEKMSVHDYLFADAHNQ